MEKEHLQNIPTQLHRIARKRKAPEIMDAKALAEELAHAKLARMDAEAANSDVEEMIWEVQHAPATAPCFAYFFAGVDEDKAATH